VVETVAIADYFATPLGLSALSSLLVLVVLYLISRRPSRVRLPTIQFLGRDPKRLGSQPRLKRFRRSLLFLLQALLLVCVALALATPTISVGAAGGEEGVVVLDASASMATESDGATRFQRAVDAAAGDLAPTASVVTAESTPQVIARRQPATDAQTTLTTLRPTDAPGDLAGAVSLATRVADPGATIHVYSDFADATDWRAAVETARAQGYRVVLHQFRGGGANNVGIVDLSFGRTDVTATVSNTGGSEATRRLSLGDQSRQLRLLPGDVTTVTFDVPAGGGRLELTPGDSFPVDDVVPISAPERDSIRVLLLTSDGNRFLQTALDVVDEVDLRVERLPAGNRALARETLAAGGGVVVTGQSDLRAANLGEFLPVVTRGIEDSVGEPTVVEDSLTAGLTFPPPGEHVDADLASGRALVSTPDGTPLVATDRRGGGQVFYYGYLDETGAFAFDYGYPVFWKRATYFASGRPSLASLNRRTGDRLTFDSPTTVRTPGGTLTASTVPLSRVGYYESANRRLGAALVSDVESRVTADPLDAATGDGPVVVDPARPAQRTDLSLVPVAVGAALLVLLGELGYLSYRGDL
jgi:hypothetical protein